MRPGTESEDNDRNEDPQVPKDGSMDEQDDKNKGASFAHATEEDAVDNVRLDDASLPTVSTGGDRPAAVPHATNSHHGPSTMHYSIFEPDVSSREDIQYGQTEEISLQPMRLGASDVPIGSGNLSLEPRSASVSPPLLPTTNCTGVGDPEMDMSTSSFESGRDSLSSTSTFTFADRLERSERGRGRYREQSSDDMVSRT
ncbi:hypothetical protein HJFPF1_02620 [Paramyrothecium foliicola]|nr:hypothetical protein HJFPF1_02620 [Paramyrothecium foliicola]